MARPAPRCFAIMIVLPTRQRFFNFYDIHMLCYRNHFIVNLLAESLPVYLR